MYDKSKQYFSNISDMYYRKLTEKQQRYTNMLE